MCPPFERFCRSVRGRDTFRDTCPENGLFAATSKTSHPVFIRVRGRFWFMAEGVGLSTASGSAKVISLRSQMGLRASARCSRTAFSSHRIFFFACGEWRPVLCKIRTFFKERHSPHPSPQEEGQGGENTALTQCKSVVLEPSVTPDCLGFPQGSRPAAHATGKPRHRSRATASSSLRSEAAAAARAPHTGSRGITVSYYIRFVFSYQHRFAVLHLLY